MKASPISLIKPVLVFDPQLRSAFKIPQLLLTDFNTLDQKWDILKLLFNQANIPANVINRRTCISKIKWNILMKLFEM